ncbi:hypothetical protein, partial [Actinoplanes sp. NPDC049265]|uniref:hypothetical protein n=1 Tax=Actinoplanes sp. NPDC049265 TaxID=3363902 RepID=UPI003711CCB5
MGESLPDTTALNNYAAEWETMANDLYNLASGVKSAAETPSWSGKAHRYYVESGHLVYQQVFDTAAQTWKVAEMIREYAKEIDKIKKQQLKEALIFIIGMALGVAAFFPGLSTLINMIGKLVATLLNALGKILPDIAKAVLPFVSTITTGAIVGAGFAVIPEGIATAITGVPFKVDPMTWGLTIGLGAGGALLLGGKNPFGKLDSHRPNITTDDGKITGTGSGSGSHAPTPGKPNLTPPTGNPKSTPNGQPLPAGPTRVPKGLRTVTNELKQEWQHTKDAFGFGPRTPTGQGPTTNQGATRGNPNGQGAPPSGRVSGNNSSPKGKDGIGPTGLKLPPGEGRTTGPTERPAANLDGPNPNPGPGRSEGGRSPAPRDSTEMGQGNADPLRQSPSEPRTPVENHNSRGLTEPPPQRHAPVADAGGGRSGPGEGSRSVGGGESANGHLNGNPNPRQALPRENGDLNGQLHGDPHGNPPPRQVQGGDAQRSTPDADLNANPRNAPSHQPDGSRPFERSPASEQAGTNNGHVSPPRGQSPAPEHQGQGGQRGAEGGAPPSPRSQSPGAEQHQGQGGQRAAEGGAPQPPRSQSPGAEQHQGQGGQRAAEGGAPQPPRSQSPGAEQHQGQGGQRAAEGGAPPSPRSQSPGAEQHQGNPGSQRAAEGGGAPPSPRSAGPEQHGNQGSQRPADQPGGAAPPKSAVNPQGKADPAQSRTPGGPEHPDDASWKWSRDNPDVHETYDGSGRRWLNNIGTGEKFELPPLRNGSELLGGGHGPRTPENPGGQHPEGNAKPSLKVNTDVNGSRPVDNSRADADVSPISPGSRDPQAKGRTESPVSPISPKAGPAHEPQPNNPSPSRSDSPEGSAAPSPTRAGNDSPRPTPAAENHVTLPAGPHDGVPQPTTRSGADAGAAKPAAEGGPKGAKEPVHTQPGGDPVKTGQYEKRVELAKTDLRAQAEAEAKMNARNTDAERTFAKEYEKWSGDGKRSLPADRKSWLEKEFVRHVEQMRQQKLDAEMNAKLPAGRTPKVKDLGRDQSYDVWQSGRWLKDAFEYHARLDGAIARVGRDFDSAYQAYQKNHPDSALKDGHVAQMKDQFISEIKNGYNTTFRDGVGTRSTSKFNKWYDELKSGLDHRFAIENELEKFMMKKPAPATEPAVPKDFSDAMRQWKSEQKLDSGTMRSWEKRVAEDLRNQLRAELTQRRPAGEFEWGRPSNWKADTAGRLKERFEQHEKLAQERQNEFYEMQNFEVREDASGFDRHVAELAQKLPDTVGKLGQEVIARQRLDYLGDSRQAYLDARRGGADHNDAITTWEANRATLEAKAGDRLVLTNKVDQTMTRALADHGRPLSDEAASWARQAHTRDLERAYVETFDGHAGELARGKPGPGADAGAQKRWDEWQERADAADRTLDNRLAYEPELRRVLDQAGRDFVDVMGPSAKPKYPMSDRVREVLANRFRDNVAASHHEFFGTPGDNIHARLASEKGGDDVFGAASKGGPRPGDDPGAGGGPRQGDDPGAGGGSPAAHDATPPAARSEPTGQRLGGNRPAAEGDASRPGSARTETERPGVESAEQRAAKANEEAVQAQARAEAARAEANRAEADRAAAEQARPKDEPGTARSETPDGEPVPGGSKPRVSPDAEVRQRGDAAEVRAAEDLAAKGRVAQERAAEAQAAETRAVAARAEADARKVEADAARAEADARGAGAAREPAAPRESANAEVRSRADALTARREQIKTEAEAQAKAEADAKAEAQVKAEAQAKADAEAKAKADADAARVEPEGAGAAREPAAPRESANAEVRSRADALTARREQIKTEAEAQAKAEADAKAEAQVKAEAQAKADAEAKAKADADAARVEPEGAGAAREPAAPRES